MRWTFAERNEVMSRYGDTVSGAEVPVTNPALAPSVFHKMDSAIFTPLSSLSTGSYEPVPVLLPVTGSFEH